MNGGAWQAAVHRIAKIRTQLRAFNLTFHFHALEKERATHSSVIAWRSPGTGEPCGLPSLGSQSRTQLKRLSSSSSSRSSSKHLHTYTETKHHPRANKFQSKTYQANSPAMEEHIPELQYTGCLKSLQTHRHLKTHYWTRHRIPEGRDPAPLTRTPTPASLTRKP